MAENRKRDEIRLSDHFTYGRLIRFTLPSIAMMIFTSIYGVVDGIFVSNFVGETPFAALLLKLCYRDGDAAMNAHRRRVLIDRLQRRMEEGLLRCREALRNGDNEQAETTLDALIRLEQEENNGL